MRYIRCAANSDKNFIDHHFRRISFIDERNNLLVISQTHMCRGGVQVDFDSIATKGLCEDLCRVAILLAEKHGLTLNDGDPGSQSAKRLCQFASQWPAPKYE